VTVFKLGMLSRSVGRYGNSEAAFLDAIAYAERARCLADEIDHQAVQVDALITLGEAYRQTARLSEAGVALEKACELLPSLGAHRSKALAFWHLATLRQHSGRLDDAGDLLEQGLQIVLAINDRRGQARLLLDLGKLRTRQNQWQEADKLLTRSMASAELIGDHQVHSEARRWLDQLRSR
jgi:tetratricopeptide (TPR) repeat protein